MQSATKIGSDWLQLIYGQVPTGVASLEFRGPRGQTEPITTGYGYYLAEIPAWTNPITLAFISPSGREVASRSLDTEPPPDPIGPRTTIASRTLDGKTFTASWYRATADRTCVNLGVGTISANRCLPTKGHSIVLDGPQSWPAHGNRITTLFGTVPSRTTTVKLTFPDGTNATVPAQNGGFLFAAAHAPLSANHTTIVQALDRNRHPIATATTP